MSKRPDRLSPCIEPRISFLIPLPELQRAKVWRRIRVGAERRSLRAQKSGAYHRRRKSLRRCAIREVYEPLTLSALRDRTSADHGGGKRRGSNAADTLNHAVSLMLSVIQWRYRSAFSYQRLLPADLDTFSLSPLRPFRPLHMFQILTSIVGRRPHNTVR